MTLRTITTAGMTVLLALSVAACSKSSAGTQDQQLTQAAQSKINADSSLQGDGIQVAVSNGVATLTGTAANNAARNAAAQDAQVQGVTQVNNEIATNTAVNEPRATGRRAAAAAEAPRVPAAAAAPERIEVSAGRELAVRLTQALSSASAAAGTSWQGTIATAVRVNGQVAIPEGAAVSGTVVAADSAGHFKGRSRLVLKLTTLDYNGATYDVASNEVNRQSSSRGSTTAKRVGIGAAIGGVIGALAGGGKGAAIGAGAGAGTGTAVQAFTKAPEVELAPETVLDFKLTAPVRVIPAGSAR